MDFQSRGQRYLAKAATALARDEDRARKDHERRTRMMGRRAMQLCESDPGFRARMAKEMAGYCTGKDRKLFELDEPMTWFDKVEVGGAEPPAAALKPKGKWPEARPDASPASEPTGRVELAESSDGKDRGAPPSEPRRQTSPSAPGLPAPSEPTRPHEIADSSDGKDRGAPSEARRQTNPGAPVPPPAASTNGKPASGTPHSGPTPRA